MQLCRCRHQDGSNQYQRSTKIILRPTAIKYNKMQRCSPLVDIRVGCDPNWTVRPSVVFVTSLLSVKVSTRFVTKWTEFTVVNNSSYTFISLRKSWFTWTTRFQLSQSSLQNKFKRFTAAQAQRNVSVRPLTAELRSWIPVKLQRWWSFPIKTSRGGLLVER